mmetsp:Transcript_10284/g.17197  ORF Transcript_10284/g.17197 Transcript_10284/m.17197 type:complete len:135 (-) Transcript_10284:282-686(-)
MERREQLILEARRDRIAWVAEAATSQFKVVGKEGSGQISSEHSTLLLESELLQRFLPSAGEFLAILNKLESEALFNESFGSQSPSLVEDEIAESYESSLFQGGGGRRRGEEEKEEEGGNGGDLDFSFLDAGWGG